MFVCNICNIMLICQYVQFCGLTGGLTSHWKIGGDNLFSCDVNQSTSKNSFKRTGDKRLNIITLKSICDIWCYDTK